MSGKDHSEEAKKAVDILEEDSGMQAGDFRDQLEEMIRKALDKRDQRFERKKIQLHVSEGYKPQSGEVCDQNS